MRKAKDPEPDPDPYPWLMDPDPGGPKTCESGPVPDSDPQRWFLIKFEAKFYIYNYRTAFLLTNPIIDAHRYHTYRTY